MTQREEDAMPIERKSFQPEGLAVRIVNGHKLFSPSLSVSAASSAPAKKTLR